jgi:hypothetical protein
MTSFASRALSGKLNLHVSLSCWLVSATSTKAPHHNWMGYYLGGLWVR